MTPGDPVPAEVRSAAEAFVRDEAGFAQIVTLDGGARPVGRTASAFLRADWDVDLIQRRGHRRNAQLLRRPQALVIWVGSPAPGSTNDHPAVFDLGLTIPRAVFVQGEVEPLDGDRTWEIYRRHQDRLRSEGLTGAPDRDRAAVEADLTGFRLRARRVRLEGFADGARSHTWNEGEGR